MPHTRNILIAYASRQGSTAEIAHAIAAEIRKSGARVEARQIGDIDSLAGYDAVIIGSAIRYDKWLPEAHEFVKTYQSTLQTLPVSMFLTCLTLSQDSIKAKQQATRYAESVAATLPHIRTTDIGQFAGVLDYRKMPRPTRLLARILFAFLQVAQGDYRNWQAIQAWAKTTLPPTKQRNTP